MAAHTWWPKGAIHTHTPLVLIICDKLNTESVPTEYKNVQLKSSYVNTTKQKIQVINIYSRVKLLDLFTTVTPACRSRLARSSQRVGKTTHTKYKKETG